MTCHLYVTGTPAEITADLMREMVHGGRLTLVSLNKTAEDAYSMCVEVTRPTPPPASVPAAPF